MRWWGRLGLSLVEFDGHGCWKYIEMALIRDADISYFLYLDYI